MLLILSRNLAICGEFGQRAIPLSSLAANGLKFDDAALLRLCSVERVAVHVLIK